MKTQVSFAEMVALVSRAPGAIKRRLAERKHRKLFRKATNYALADVPEGAFAKVTGIVRPFEQRLLEAPFSGRLCVYYDLSVDATVDGALLRVLATEQEAVTFVLEDDGHRAVVDASHATISTGIDYVSESDTFIGSERENVVLRRNGLSGRSLSLANGLRFREAILEADERVAIFGCGVRETDPDAPPGGLYRDAGHTRLRLTGTAKYPLMITDDPKST